MVSEVLGHSSVANTQDIYGHLVEGQKRAATEAHVSPASARHWLPKWLPMTYPGRRRAVMGSGK